MAHCTGTMAHTKTEWWLTLTGQVAQTSQEYSKMARENKEYAELFYDLISEAGVDVGVDLSDKEFMSLICR